MNKRFALPAASLAVVQQMEEPPPIVLPEDRDAFLAGVEPEHQTEAEEAWNNMAEQTENQERQRRARVKDTTQPRRTPYFLSVEQVATRWNVSSRTVWRMIHDGRLPSTQIGNSRRIREEDVEKVETEHFAVA